MASLPTTAAPQRASAPSFTKLFGIYLKAFLLMLVLHTFFIVCAGIILRLTSSANHIRHLASFWGFMAGTSGASLLLGLCSARRHDRTLIVFGRATLLISFLGSILLGLLALGINLLSKSDHRDWHVSPLASLLLSIVMAVSFSLICCCALYIVDYLYVRALTEAAGQGATDSIRLPDYTRWVAGITTPFSGAREQPDPTSESHEMSGLQVGDQSNSNRWFSRTIRRQGLTPESPLSEKEPLLSNLDLASNVV